MVNCRYTLWLLLGCLLANGAVAEEPVKPPKPANQADEARQESDIERLARRARESIVQVTFSGREGCGRTR